MVFGPRSRQPAGMLVALSLLARPDFASHQTPLAQFPGSETLRLRTPDQERFRSVFRFILSSSSGKKERPLLQAARKVVTVLVVEDDWLICEDMATDPSAGRMGGVGGGHRRGRASAFTTPRKSIFS